MYNSTHNSELLVRYLDGELTGEEKEQLERQLEINSALKDELENLKIARSAVRSFGLKEKVTAVHKEMMKELRTPVKKISSERLIIRYTMAAAASVLLIVLGITAYNYFTVSSEKVFAKNYIQYELTTVRNDSTVETAVESAYRRKDYKGVTELAAKNPAISIKESFLQAMSYLELKDNAKAIEKYREILAANEKGASMMKDEAEYYLALAYTRNTDYNSALDLMKKIKDDPDHLYHKRITGKLMRRLRMLKWR